MLQKFSASIGWDRLYFLGSRFDFVLVPLLDEKLLPYLIDGQHGKQELSCKSELQLAVSRFGCLGIMVLTLCTSRPLL
jgi:hypothetical protein